MNTRVQESAATAGVTAPVEAERRQPLTLRYRVDDALLYEAMVASGKVLLRLKLPGERTSGWRAVAVIIVILVGIAAVVDLVRYSGAGVEMLYAVFGLVLGFAIYTAWLNRSYRRIARLMAANPVHGGEVAATLDAGGIELRGAASHARLDWQAVEEVVIADSGALVLVVPTQILALPASALPAGGAAALKARIEAWRRPAA